MSTEFKVAQGKWIQSHREIPNDEDGMYATQVYTEDGRTIATLSWYPKPQVEGEYEGRPVLITGTYRDEHAILIADAGNTIQSCGLIPSEILKQRDEMIALLKEVKVDIDLSNDITDSSYKKLLDILKSAEVKH